jgi:ABC-type nitrate/sulfonate/bicarbonate transport system permease component
MYNSFYPALVVSQTIPIIAIAPLLVLWLGFGQVPKIAVVALSSLFPVTIGLLNGFREADTDAVSLLKAMGAGRWQIFRHIKMPFALNGFFASLKIAVTYSLGGAVYAEVLGGNEGLGVYMMRIRRSYAFDKMFAAIFLIIILSLLLMWAVIFLEKCVMPWKIYDKNK